jgi:hypothetical protein
MSLIRRPLCFAVLVGVALALPLSHPGALCLRGAPAVSADAPVVTLPASKTAKPNRYFCLKAGGNCPTVKWIIPDGLEQLDPSIPLADKLAIVLIGDTGTYTVRCYGALGDVASDVATCTVTIGEPTPPVPPVPPVPPGPTPGPAPIPASGLRVLIVFDDATAASLPAGQREIIYGQATRDFLNAKTVVGTDGKTKEWRFWPKSVATAGETQLWQDAFKRTNGKALPYLLISNGTSGYEGALPATAADFQTLVSKYAAPSKPADKPAAKKKSALVVDPRRRAA